MLEAKVQANIGRLRLDVSLETSQTLAIVGPNGAGKTSLLSLLLGVKPAKGFMRVGDAVLLDTGRGVNVPTERRRLGYVPQDYALFPHMTARENVAFAVSCVAPKLTRDAQDQRTATLLHELDLDRLADQYPKALSGGEQQRVALARAVAAKPRALLLDEPFAALDIGARREVRGFLKNYLARLALPTLVITHDAADARALAAEVAVMEQGKITQRGAWEAVAAQPLSGFTRAFFGVGG